MPSIGDITSLATAVNTQVPGAGETNEIWLDVPSGGDDAADGTRSPSRRSAASSRSRGRTLLDEARDDPLGHGTLLALDSAAVVALLLAALGLALTVLSDLRDDRGDLYDLESQGAEPRLLRRIVRVRALVVGDRGRDRGRRRRGAARAPRHAGRLGDGARRRTSDPAACRRRSTSACVVRRRRSPTCCSRRRSSALATRRAFRDDRGPARAQEAGT